MTVALYQSGRSCQSRTRSGRGEIGRRSRLQLECPWGNPRCRTAQSRGTLTGHKPQANPEPSPQPGEGVETGRVAPKAERLRRRDSPDHERRRAGGGESRSGKKICFSVRVRVQVPPSAPPVMQRTNPKISPHSITNRNNMGVGQPVALRRLESNRPSRDNPKGPSRRRHISNPLRHNRLQRQILAHLRCRCSHHRPRPNALHRTQSLALHPQHPAQRRQDPPRLRHIAHQRHHLRIAQQMRQLRATPGRLIAHELNQPTETPRQHNRRPLRRPTRAPFHQNWFCPAPATGLPPGPHPLHQRQKPVLCPVQPLIAGHHKVRRQRGRTPAATQASGHRPAHTRGDLPELARATGKERIIHERSKNLGLATCNSKSRCRALLMRRKRQTRAPQAKMPWHPGTGTNFIQGFERRRQHLLPTPPRSPRQSPLVSWSAETAPIPRHPGSPGIW